MPAARTLTAAGDDILMRKALDALYGVSMRGDSVTTVVSQRVKDVAPAGATRSAALTVDPATPSVGAYTITVNESDLGRMSAAEIAARINDHYFKG